jgi:hypothetical protein
MKIEVLLALFLITFQSIACETTQASYPDERAAVLCGRLGEIRELPFKGEHVDDPVYNALVAAGKAALPCLIDSLDDTTPTPDPRKAPRYEAEVVIGDVAFFVMPDLADVSMEQLLPDEILDGWRNEGMAAYFRYVSKPGNRRALQSYIRGWYERFEEESR